MFQVYLLQSSETIKTIESLPPGDRLGVRGALASLDFLKRATADLEYPIESLDERRLVD